MCDPVSLTIAATAASIAGSAYSGISSYQQANYQAGVARNNATLSRNEAADAVDRGKRAELVKWREIAAQRSGQVAAAAANGIDTSFGSPADAVADTMKFGSMDASLIRQNAEREATGFQINAQNYEEEAKAQKRAGRNALISTGFEIAGTALGAAGQIKGMSSPTKLSAPKSPMSFGGAQKHRSSL